MNGRQALDQAHRRSFDVVLLDLGLPGVDGYEVAGILKQLHPAPFVIAITGYGREEDRRHSFAAGVDLHLLKPINPEELEMLLARLR
jgi:CheY-like chemotaxis protein